MQPEERTPRDELAARIGEYLHTYVAVADAKAGALGGAAGALLLFVSTQIAEGDGEEYLLTAAAVGLSLAFVASLSSLYPRKPSSGRSV